MELAAETTGPILGTQTCAAVSRMYDDHASSIHRYASRRVGREAALDVVGDVFVIALDRYGQYDPDRGNPSAWLFGIANNVLRRYWRTELRRLETMTRSRAAIGATDPLAAVDDRLDARDGVAQIIDLVIAMPEADRELLWMIAWEHFTYDEVAAIVGIPTGTVRSRLHRIRQHLEHHTNHDTGRTP